MKDSKNHITPPRLAERLLLWFLKSNLAEEVLGDLDEKFYQTINSHSLFRARVNYWFQVLNYLRPFALKKHRSTHSNHSAMFKHNLLISFRSFKRYKSTFLINLFGLATGLASALLIYLWVNDELNTGRFKEKDSDRHVQVFVNTNLPGGIHTNHFTPIPLAQDMEAVFPEVVKGIPIIEEPYYKGVISHGDVHLRAIPKFVGEGYFDVFGCDLVAGSKATLEKKDVAISEKLANSLFNGAEEAIGQTVNFLGTYMDGPYIVSAVFEPTNSGSMPFDMLLSFDEFLVWRPEIFNWRNGGTQTHLILNENVDTNEFNAKIEDYLKTKFKNTRQTLIAQDYADNYLYGKFENGQPVAGRVIHVRIFSAIGAFILLIACINYMNLSTAQASRRIKEIGVKKAIGAHRRTLVYQYFGESMVMSFLSLFLAIGIATLLLPQFNEITGKVLSIASAAGIILPVVVITLITGLISGIYPGLYLSGFKPVLALKGKIKSGSTGLSFRKGLVVFQFIVSVTLIISAVTIYRQINFIRNSNLGYNTEQLVSFKSEGDLIEDSEAFVNEARKIPGVVNVSHMWGDLGGKISGGSNVRWKDQDPESRKIEFHFIEGGHDMASLIGVELIAGRFISKDFSTDNLDIVINEAAARLLGFEDPIGQQISRGDKYTIVGVVKDFHFHGMQDEIQPFFFMPDTSGNTFVARIQGENSIDIINKIEDLYASFNPEYPFEFKFVDDNYQLLYEEERRVATLSKYFSAVAIAISCLGLLALTAFNTQRRFKEIAIRKVLGSSSLGIARLLSNEFAGLVLVAITIALPLGYFLMKNWLDGFAYRINLEPVFFIAAGAIMFSAAWLTIMVQTTKSANVNITESLKNE